MKKANLKIILSLLVMGSVFWTSCKDDSISDQLGREAKIMISFKVTGTSGTVFNSVIEEDSIKIKISPYLDVNQELKDVVPVFYLSKGATVSPDPTTPQDFTQDGGVVYTVLSEDKKHKKEYVVTWTLSDKLPFGEGFSYAEITAKKTFPELNYPGEVANFNLEDPKQFGDLKMYHAYCGNYIVLLSRAYIESNNAQYGIRVFDKTSLADAGTLNMGTILPADLKMITSDYKGRCVGAVVKGNETEFFYWVKPTDSPVSVGTIHINMAPSTSDLSNNMQVAGDITENAWITALAPRDTKGSHYRVKVTGGKLATSYTSVETGYSSIDCGGFQMISPLDDSDNPYFVVGDTEGSAGKANSIHCYVNNFTGSTLNVMPGLWQNVLQTWWVGTGFSITRTGGRAPVVSALPINGKTYVVVTSGTAWWHAAAVLTPDLATLAHENLNIAFSTNRAWSYGSWVDWYWDDDKQEAYLSVWFGRLGLHTYKMTCFE